VTSFGRPFLDRWFLDPEFSYLNHGTVGATPRQVLAQQWKVMEEIERHPAQVMLRDLANPMALDWPGEPPLLRRVAATVADYVGADVDGLALVDNITTGASAVLRSLMFEPGDVIAVTNIGYGGVTNAVRFVAERSGATVHVIDLPTPGASPAEFATAFHRQLRPDTKLAVVDHLAAFSALVLPVEEFIASCRSKAVMVLVDGAHVPGQLQLDVNQLGADWYTANLHKWAWTPRTSGFLWAAPQHRDSLHPPVISWGLGRGLAAEFDLTGTRDPSPFLVVGEVFKMRAALGENAIRTYNHDLAWTAASYLADHWATPFSTPESMIGSMVTVRLPGRLGSSTDDAEAVRRWLYDRHKVEVPIFAVGLGPSTDDMMDAYGVDDADPGLVIRVSTQIYNDSSDIERLAGAVDAAPSPTTRR